MKQIKIAFIDGCGGDDLALFSRVLKENSENCGDEFEFIIDEKNPQFIVYSVFGTRHIHYDCVRIFHTAENCRADFNFCDYAITYDYLDFGARHLRYPYYLRNLVGVDKNSAIYQKSAFCAEFAKRKFCSFVVSNGKADELRSAVFEALSAYKKVDSAGRFKNNVGFLADDKIAFLRKYKFNICFENSDTAGYVTEKIIDAKKADSVPIYWGGGIS
ncbi:glycosyltransferase family 10 domain-containing protein [Helicobacter sp. 23-1045]